MEASVFEGAEQLAPRVFVVRLDGEFDLAERERLTDAFGIAQSAQLVVVNLQKTTYIDSTVLQCLVVLHAATEKRGAKLVFVGAQGSVLRLFEICELHKIFDIRSTLNDVPEFDGAQARRLTIEARPIADEYTADPIR